MLLFLGVSIEAALAATILLRGFTFWLPMDQGCGSRDANWSRDETRRAAPKAFFL